MTAPELVIWATVLGVGIPSAWRNPTSAALVLAWFVGQAVYLFTGNNLPVEYYIFPDIFVLTVIFCKAEVCDLRPYKSIWHQMQCTLLERSPSDRIVMLIFPLMWCLYVAEISAWAKWWALYWLVLIQFIAAGVEAFIAYRRDADAADLPDDNHTGALLVAYRKAGYG